MLLSEVTPRALKPRLLSGEFDVALSYQDATSPRREIPDVERIDLMRETFLVGLPPEYRLASTPGPLPLAQLADDDWILPSTEGFLIDACREAGFEPHVVALSQEPVGTRGMIARGLGVGWVPGLLVEDTHGIVMREIDGPSRHRDIYALLPPGERHPHARRVLAALQAAAADFGAHPSRANPRDQGRRPGR